MSSHFGQKIKDAWKLSGLSQKEFSEKLRMSLRNSQHLFERDDFSIQQLITISQVLKVDLVSMYLEDYTQNKDYPHVKNDMQFNSVNENVSDYTKTINEVTFQLNVKGEFNVVAKHFPEFLKLVKNEAEKIGFKLS